MRYTGWAVLILALLIGLYAFFTSAPPAQVPPTAETTPVDTPGSPTSLDTVLYVFSGLGVAAGLLMLLVGGRGVIKTKNLAVRR